MPKEMRQETPEGPQAEMKRELDRNYLVIRAEKQDMGSYQARMLLGGSLPSLLPCRVQQMDNQSILYYDVTSRQSLRSCFEGRTMREKELRLIFGSLSRVLEELRENMVDPSLLLLDPDHIFIDAGESRLFFAGVPMHNGELPGQLLFLLEYLLPKLDHDDGAAVSLGYGLYRSAASGKFSQEELKQFLYGTRTAEKEEGSQNMSKSRGSAGEFEYEGGFEDEGLSFMERLEAEESPGEERTRGRSGRGRVLLWCLSAAVLFLAGAALIRFGYLPGISPTMLLAIATGGLGAGLFVTSLRKWLKEKKEAALLPEPGPASFKADSLQEDDRTEFSLFQGYMEEEEDCGETMFLQRPAREGGAFLEYTGEGNGEDLFLTPGITMVGKLKKTCDAVIPAATVSRVHARIRKMEDGGYYLRDLNSRNGTLLNGRPLGPGEEVALSEGDMVKFAQEAYRFHAASGGEKEPGKNIRPYLD